MTRFPAGFRLEPLRKDHPRDRFLSGQGAVDAWLATRALQSQGKHLSATHALCAENGVIAGFYTLATGQVDMGDLPPEAARGLPRRALPVAVLAWLGVDRDFQGQGLGGRLLAQALSDCHSAGRAFPFVAVVLDCIDEAAKAFYRRWGFQEVPGRPMRLFLPAAGLEALMARDRTGSG